MTRLATENRTRVSIYVIKQLMTRADVVEPVKFSSHLVWSPCTTLLTVSRIPSARTYEVPKTLGTLGSRPRNWGCGWPLETRSSSRVTVPNLVVLGQTLRAYARRFAGKWPLASRLSTLL